MKIKSFYFYPEYHSSYLNTNTMPVIVEMTFSLPQHNYAEFTIFTRYEITIKYYSVRTGQRWIADAQNSQLPSVRRRAKPAHIKK